MFWPFGEKAAPRAPEVQPLASFYSAINAGPQPRTTNARLFYMCGHFSATFSVPRLGPPPSHRSVQDNALVVHGGDLCNKCSRRKGNLPGNHCLNNQTKPVCVFESCPLDDCECQRGGVNQFNPLPQLGPACVFSVCPYSECACKKSGLNEPNKFEPGDHDDEFFNSFPTMLYRGEARTFRRFVAEKRRRAIARANQPEEPAAVINRIWCWEHLVCTESAGKSLWAEEN